MNSSLTHLAAEQHKMLAMAVRIIARAIQPEKIILFGLFGADGDARLWQSLPPALAAFDLLVITPGQERRSDYELQDIIESRCREVAAVKPRWHQIDYTNTRGAA